MNFETLHTQSVYHGRVFNIRVDTVRLPDDRVMQLDVVEHQVSVALLPIDTEAQVWFVRQYRHAAGQNLLELPAGTLDGDESPEDCARREAREEIGMAVGNLQELGGFFLTPGYSTEYLHVYLATDLHPAPLEADADEFLSVEKIPLQQVFRLVESGQIHDAKTLAALFLARNFLNIK